MECTRHENAVDFLAQVGPLLEAAEPMSTLMLGTALRLTRQTEPPKIAPFLFTARQNGAPALAALMTPPHPLVLHAFSNPAQEAFERLAAVLAEDGFAVTRAVGPDALAARFSAAWASKHPCSCELDTRMRVFKLDAVTAPLWSAGRLRAATNDDAELVVRWRDAFHREAMGNEGDPEQLRERTLRDLAAGDIFLWDDGGPVSMATKARPTQRGVTVNGVYTPPELRGQGYASSCVAALSQQLLDSGYAYCTLFTDLSNPTSNHIYQQIGYRPVGDINAWQFN
jgi:hypothetical protein